jgi:hypothetical protein
MKIGVLKIILETTGIVCYAVHDSVVMMLFLSNFLIKKHPNGFKTNRAFWINCRF